jgi:hypothetical protein
MLRHEDVRKGQTGWQEADLLNYTSVHKIDYTLPNAATSKRTYVGTVFLKVQLNGSLNWTIKYRYPLPNTMPARSREGFHTRLCHVFMMVP